MLIEKRKDPYSGEEFYPKRYNQKFATRENQIAFNNIIAREKRQQKNGTDRILDKNREVLKRILAKYSSIIKSKDYLLGAGFNFNYFSCIRDVDEQTVFAIYEFTIKLHKTNLYLIEKT